MCIRPGSRDGLSGKVSHSDEEGNITLLSICLIASLNCRIEGM